MMHTQTHFCLLLIVSTFSHMDIHLHTHSKSLSLQQEDCLEQVINDTECLFKSREKEYQETIDQIEVRHLLHISKLQIATIVLTLFLYCVVCTGVELKSFFFWHINASECSVACTFKPWLSIKCDTVLLFLF